MGNILGLDTDGLMREHYPQLLAELQSWEEMNASDDNGDGTKRRDVRTIVRESAESFAADPDNDGNVSYAREMVGNVVSDLLNSISDRADAISFVTSVLADAANTANDRAKYLHKMEEPEAVDLDSDLVELHSVMSERRDAINQLLKSGNYVAQNLVQKGKRTKGTVVIDDMEVPVTVGKDSSGETVLTVDHRLPNSPGTGTPGRKITTSKLSFEVDGEPFRPVTAIASKHLAWKINALGANVPVEPEAFMTYVQSVTNQDYYSDWEADFNGVHVKCRENG